jgi:cysteine-rich repeat protein
MRRTRTSSLGLLAGVAVLLLLPLAAALPARAGNGGACGNGTLESGEECDDANTAPGDGCSAACRIEGPLDRSQQGCVNKVNGAFAGAVAAANKAGLGCLKQIAKGSTAPGFAACAGAADLSSAFAKAAKAVAKKCDGKGVEPASTFAYGGDPASVAQAALDQTLGAHLDLLGDPDAVADRSSGAPAICQKTALSGLARYLDDLAKATNQAKKRSLKGKGAAPAADSAELAAALEAARDSAKATRSLDKSSAKTARKCAGQDLAGLFPGVCAASASASELGACAGQVARCRYCLALDEADQLSIDCAGYAGVPSCEAAVCGDGELGAGEACDDGNTADGDGCRSDCTSELCGDGALDPGEACDDGGNEGGDGCRADCSLELCGDGLLDAGEACDDGNTSDGDGCSSSCSLESCGNGSLEGSESCDDGNTVDGDGCRANCTEELCGDGLLDPAEACDDGNTADGDGCRSDCTMEICGDGLLDAGEQCDDGNLVGGDGCDADCLVPQNQEAPPDANFNSPLNIPLDSTASVTDFVSYPGGDHQDKVRWDIIGMNPNSSLSGGRARLTIAVSCFGSGIPNVQFFTGGQTFSCGQTIVDREVTYDSRTGQVTITAVGGANTYVQWVLTGTATRVN